ncbi:MAG: HlyD family efflux transporter periplasmic adaptor subunit [Pseudomonadota bacterium]
MGKRRQIRVLGRHVRTRPRFSSLVWVLAGPLACFALVMVVGWASLSRPIEDARQFQGVLRPVATPIGVALPEHSVLETIVVSQGDVVRSGQTLATLDIPAMEDRRRVVMRELAIKQLERHCLSHDAPTAFDDTMGVLIAKRAEAALAGAYGVDADAEWVEEFRTALELTASDCRLRHAAWTAALQGAEDAVVREEARASLLDQKLAILVERRSVADAAAIPALAAEAVETLIAQNTLQETLMTARAGVETMTLDRRDRRLAEARALTVQIDALQREERHLGRILADPRVVAPVTGLVARLRSPGPGYVARADTKVFELAKSGARRFTLAMSVAPGDLARLPDGAPVTLSLAGAAMAPPLGGRLDLDRNDAHGGAAPGTVLVNLDGQARAWLGSEAGTLALNGGATASRVQVALEASELGTQLQDIARGMMTPSPWIADTLGPVLARGAAAQGVN